MLDPQAVELARLSLAGLAHLDDPAWTLAPHIRLIVERVENTIRCGGNLLVVMPPRHGKSHTLSMYLPAWYLGTYPERNVLLASYEAEFAASWGLRARNLLERFGPQVFDARESQFSRARDHWLVETRDQGAGWRLQGGMHTAGAGGAITGRGGHLCICDDPVKNAEQAMSRTFREKTWDWWRSTFWTRREPGAATILVLTRWHQDDIAGRILASDEASDWEVCHLPALAGDSDALGRQSGEALWPARFNADALSLVRADIGPSWWESLYQGNPMPDDGAVFRAKWFRYFEEPRSGVYDFAGRMLNASEVRARFLTCDLAVSTKERADYTALCAWGITPWGELVLLDTQRARMEGPDILPAIKALAARWGARTVWVERVAFQLALVQDARRQGIPVRELTPDRDKIARAYAATPALEGGQVWFPKHAGWLKYVEAELLGFPTAAHDDSVDAVAYGVQVWRSMARWRLQGGGEAACEAPADFGRMVSDDFGDEPPEPTTRQQRASSMLAQRRLELEPIRDRLKRGEW